MTPTYYAQQLYALHASRRPLRIEADASSGTGLDVSATLSEDGGTVTLFAVNDSLEQVRRTLDLSALAAHPQDVTVWTHSDREHAGEPDVTNSFDDPQRVYPVRSSVHASGSTLPYRFPPLSLTLLQAHVSPTAR